MLHHLLNVNTFEELECHPIRGASWETFVIEDIIRREEITNPFSQYSFWRTHTGHEIDLILKRGSDLHAIEIKVGTMLRADHLKKLSMASKDIEAKSSTIISQSAASDSPCSGIQGVHCGANYTWIP